MQTIHPGVDNTDVTPTALNCTAVTAAVAACRTQLRTKSTFEYLIIKYVCLLSRVFFSLLATFEPSEALGMEN